MGLLSLIPGKHATFNLTVTIDDIRNVPLVNGSLSVGWRFKKYTSKDTEAYEARSPVPSVMSSPKEESAAEPNTLQHMVTLQRMITQTQSQSQSGSISSDQTNTPSHDLSNDDDEDGVSLSSLSINQNRNRSSANLSVSSLESRLESLEERPQGRLQGWKSRTRKLKKSLLSTATTATHSSTNDEERLSDSASIGSSPSNSRSHSYSNKFNTRGESGSSATSPSAIGVETSPSYVPPMLRRSRGETAKIPINDHACSWSQRIRSGIQISVNKDGMLGEQWLKFVVLQHLSPSDSSAHAEKDILLGQLKLNLAEYAGFGPVTRRYLLDEGKTNATLKVCIELEQIGGQKEWNPTTITKGQISGGGLESLVGHDKGSLAATPVMSSTNLNRLCAEARPSFSRKSSDHSQSHPRPSSLSQSAKAASGPSTPPLQAPSSSHNTSHNPHLLSSFTPSGSSTNLHLLGSSLQHHLLPHSKASSLSSNRKPNNHAKSHSPSPLPDNQPRTRGQPTIGTLPNEQSHQTKKSQPFGFQAPTRTEDIIEALFNPFESSTVGPFTVPHSSGGVSKASDEVTSEDVSVQEGEANTGGKPKKRAGWKPHHKDKDTSLPGIGSGAALIAAVIPGGDENGGRKKNSGDHGFRHTSGKGFGWKTKERTASTGEIRV